MALAPKQYHELVNALANIDLDDTELHGKTRGFIVSISAMVEVYRAKAEISERGLRRVLKIAAEQETRLLYA